VIEYLRLAFGTVVVLLPGAAVARAVGHRSASATLAWGLGCVFVAWGAVFTFHRSIHLAVAVLAVLLVAGVLVARRRTSVERAPRSVPVWLFGIVLGWFLWHVEGAVVGDGLFHEARVRKLVDLTSLHLKTVDEFRDGGLHPGYAFPLWHGFLALVAWCSGLDPEQVARHESSVLAPIACVIAWEAGVAVFRSRAAGVTVLFAQLAIACFAPGHGGAWAFLALPATAARQLLVPAAIALFFQRRLASTAVAFGVLTLTHPTYALFLLIPLLAVAFWEWRAWLAGAIPSAIVVAALSPVIDQAVSHQPGQNERVRALRQYADLLVIENLHHFRLKPEVFDRTGSVAVATLTLLPLVAVAIRRRWAQFALGGAVLVLLIGEVPWLFVHLADSTSLSQARRFAGFVPMPFAFAGIAALVSRRLLVVPGTFVLGIVLQRLWPGDFGVGLGDGEPALATWIGLVGGLVALAAAAVRRPTAPRDSHVLGAVAAFWFVLPVLVHGVWHWSPATERDPLALRPGLVRQLRTTVPKGAVVLAPVQMSYRVAAVAPVYIVAAPVAHVANTTANDPYRRARAVRHWVRTSDPRIAKRYGAEWQIRNGRLSRVPRG